MHALSNKPPTAKQLAKAILSCRYDEDFLVGDSGPDAFLHRIDGVITATSGCLIDVTAGSWRVFYGDAVRAVLDDMTVAEMMDAYQETLDCYEALMDIPTERFNAEVQAAMAEKGPFIRNLMLIDEIDLAPVFRTVAQEVGLLRELVRHFAKGAEVVALDIRTVNPAAALAVGFKPIAGTHLMVVRADSV